MSTFHLHSFLFNLSLFLDLDGASANEDLHQETLVPGQYWKLTSRRCCRAILYVESSSPFNTFSSLAFFNELVAGHGARWQLGLVAGNTWE